MLGSTWFIVLTERSYDEGVVGEDSRKLCERAYLGEHEGGGPRASRQDNHIYDRVRADSTSARARQKERSSHSAAWTTTTQNIHSRSMAGQLEAAMKIGGFAKKNQDDEGKTKQV